MIHGRMLTLQMYGSSPATTSECMERQILKQAGPPKLVLAVSEDSVGGLKAGLIQVASEADFTIQ
jgi:hypothetical protein